MCTTYDNLSTRFARDVVTLNTQLAFRRLPNALLDAELLHRVERPNGLTTLTVRTDQLPDRYLLGLMGFRLAQYLQLGYACRQVVHAAGMFAEPAHHLADDDIHVVTLDARGRILGYLSLAGSGDARPYELIDPARRPFPVEVAHDLNLFHRVEPVDGVRSDQVRELKRFVHSRLMQDKEQRLQVTLELLLGAGRACCCWTRRSAPWSETSKKTSPCGTSSWPGWTSSSSKGRHRSCRTTTSCIRCTQRGMQ